MGHVRSLTASLSAFPALNAGAFEAAMAILSPVPGLRPWRAARVLVVEAPEARDGDRVAARQRLGDGGEDGADHAVRGGPGHGGLCGHMGRQLGAVHGDPPSRCDRTSAACAGADEGAESSAGTQRAGWLARRGRAASARLSRGG